MTRSCHASPVGSVLLRLALSCLAALLVGAGCTRAGTAGSALDASSTTTSTAGEQSSATTLPSPPTAARAMSRPCSLVDEEAVETLTGFDTVAQEIDTQDAMTGGRRRVCAVQHRTAGIPGGYVGFVPYQPEEIRELFSEVPADLEARGGGRLEILGHPAVIGDVDASPGAGFDFVMVDMGSGGFVVNVSLTADVDKEVLLAVAEAAARRWKQAQDGSPSPAGGAGP